MESVKLSAMAILIPISIATLTACAEKETHKSQTSLSNVGVPEQETVITPPANTSQSRFDINIDAEIFDYEAEKFIEANKN
jgi:hypothetical protein